MQMTDVKNPGERNKIIGAAVLGLIAIILLWWTFFGFGSSSNPAARQATGPATAPNLRTATQTPVQPPQDAVDLQGDLNLTPIRLERVAFPVPEPRRNIFAFAEPKPSPVASAPTPTPTPTPPILLAAVSPSMVYARTADFTLEVTGDKFVPGLRVVVDNDNELQTRYAGPQQLSAVVPAAMIANPGARQISIRSHDAKLYSNGATLNVAAPPTPNYSYIGILGTPRFIDTAILQDKSNKEVLNVQKGDLLGGRFRVNSISEKEIVVVDTNLKIKHTIAFSVQGDRSGPQQRPTPKVESEDDEP